METLTPPDVHAALDVEPLTIADRTFRSRLFLGSGKYPDFDTMRRALEVSGTEVVTVALRRVNLDERGKGSMLDAIDPARYLLLPNTDAQHAGRSTWCAGSACSCIGILPTRWLCSSIVVVVIIISSVDIRFGASAGVEIARR